MSVIDTGLLPVLSENGLVTLSKLVVTYNHVAVGAIPGADDIAMISLYGYPLMEVSSLPSSIAESTLLNKGVLAKANDAAGDRVKTFALPMVPVGYVRVAVDYSENLVTLDRVSVMTDNNVEFIIRS